MDQHEQITAEWIHRRLSAHQFWMLQILFAISGVQPATMADWVRQRCDLLKRTPPPEDGSVSPSDYDRAICAILAHVEDVATTLAEDLDDYQRLLASGESKPPPNFSGSGTLDAAANPEQLGTLLSHMVSEQFAQRYWLMEAYSLMSGGRPGLMAAQVHRKLGALKNAPPTGPADMSPEQLDAAMVNDLPPILAFGEDMASRLALAQEVASRKG